MAVKDCEVDRTLEANIPAPLSDAELDELFQTPCNYVMSRDELNAVVAGVFERYYREVGVAVSREKRYLSYREVMLQERRERQERNWEGDLLRSGVPKACLAQFSQPALDLSDFPRVNSSPGLKIGSLGKLQLQISAYEAGEVESVRFRIEQLKDRRVFPEAVRTPSRRSWVPDVLSVILGHIVESVIADIARLAKWLVHRPRWVGRSLKELFWSVRGRVIRA